MANAASIQTCPLCGIATSRQALREAGWMPPAIVAELEHDHPNWRVEDGACPACIQQALLHTLLAHGDAALHEAVQAVWPLDAEAAFGALPTPLRLHSDPRYTGKGVTVAMVDSAFYPHPDLVQPVNRIRAWVDVAREPIQAAYYGPDETPAWPGWDRAEASQWHGLMTSVVAAGNGWLSHGLYRGLASQADLVLVQVYDGSGHIGNEHIARALRWIGEHAAELGVKVVSVSLGGDPLVSLAANPVDAAVAALVADGICVVVAAGNDGERRLVPPATAPEALTVGGLDDHNSFDHAQRELWHSSYGETEGLAPKPELVAPSIWVVAPLLPGSAVALEAAQLFARRAQGNQDVEAAVVAERLVTPYYQHVDGTSFAAPLVASTIACMLQANPTLTPQQVRDVLIRSAQPVAGAPVERQGAGSLDAGQALAMALRERHGPLASRPLSPWLRADRVGFLLHEHDAQHVAVLGEWDDWLAPGLAAVQVEPGVWQAEGPSPPTGRYSYKFVIDGSRWQDDPGNPHKAPDSYGGLNSLLIVPPTVS